MTNEKSKPGYYPLERRLYVITALTNMHVGSGDEGFGLIDNRVQRDAVSGLPCINASSLKGALREYYDNKWGDGEAAKTRIRTIFGSENSGQSEDFMAGQYRFFSGNLLTLPVRSNGAPFYRATSPAVLKELLNALDTFAADPQPPWIEALKKTAPLEPAQGRPLLLTKPATGDNTENTEQEIFLEEYSLNAFSHRDLPADDLKALEPLLGERPALLHDDDFAELCDDYHLPLVARNKLENGLSKNLWHEQVVPRESRFYFFTLSPGNCGHRLEFSGGEPVQIGAGATIGYGFCRITDVGQPS